MPEPFKIVLLQLAVTLGVALVFWVFKTPEVWPALLGGAVVVVPNALFAWVAMKRTSATAVLINGAIKFAVSIVLIVVAFQVFAPTPMGFFSAFAAALAAHAVGAAVFASGKSPLQQ